VPGPKRDGRGHRRGVCLAGEPRPPGRPRCSRRARRPAKAGRAGRSGC